MENNENGQLNNVVTARDIVSVYALMRIQAEERYAQKAVTREGFADQLRSDREWVVSELVKLREP